nr:class I SAM-dependent methyltransferase [Kineosporia rhizophila]
MHLLGLPSGRSLVDVGCGTGYFLRLLAENGHRGRLIGVDLSPAAVDEVARIPGVQGVPGNAEQLPLPADGVQLCTALYMLYHVPDPVAALREFARVTEPGGRVAVLVNHHRTTARTMDWVREIAERHGADLADSGLNGVTSDTLPGLMEEVFGEGAVRATRVDNALAIPGPQPLIDFAVAALTFCGVSPSFPGREAVIRDITAEAHAWFSTPGRVWRDPKGYVVCVANVG